MSWIDTLEHLRTGYPKMSAGALILAGCVLGGGAAWFLLRQQIENYRTRIEHLQDVIADRLPGSSYKPIRFTKGRSMIAGFGLLICGLLFAGIGAAILFWNVGDAPAPPSGLTSAVTNPASPPKALTTSTGTPAAGSAPLVVASPPKEIPLTPDRQKELLELRDYINGPVTDFLTDAKALRDNWPNETTATLSEKLRIFRNVTIPRIKNGLTVILDKYGYQDIHDLTDWNFMGKIEAEALEYHQIVLAIDDAAPNHPLKGSDNFPGENFSRFTKETQRLEKWISDTRAKIGAKLSDYVK